MEKTRWRLAPLGLLLLAGAASAATVSATCTATPCTSWTVTLPPFTGNPSVVLDECWDCERPDEGWLHVNDERMPIFGELGVAQNNDRICAVPDCRMGYELPQGWLVPGFNRITVTWNTQQSPAYHDVGDLRVEFEPAAAPIPPPRGPYKIGCRIASRPIEGGGARFLRGCTADGFAGSTYVAVMTLEESAIALYVARKVREGERLKPIPQPGIAFAPTAEPCDIAALWGAQAASCPQ